MRADSLCASAGSLPLAEQQLRGELGGCQRSAQIVGQSQYEQLTQIALLFEFDLGLAQSAVRQADLDSLFVVVHFCRCQPRPVGHERRDILDPMQDVGELPLSVEHRRVDRAPVALLEVVGVSQTNIVFLYRHCIGHSMFEHAFEGGREVGGAMGLGIVRVVRKDFEDVLADDRIALSHGCPEVGIVDRGDDQLRGNDQIGGRCSMEQAAEVGLVLPGLGGAPRGQRGAAGRRRHVQGSSTVTVHPA